MALATQTVVEKIAAVAERIGNQHGVEIVDAELMGGGIHRVLRVYIDKPEGVTLDDCQNVSHELGEVLDAEDVVPGAYTLEVSSPGVDRKLTKAKDFERFVGQKVKVALKQAVDGSKRVEGVLEAFSNDVATLTVAQGKNKEPKQVLIELNQIDKANLKFEW